MLWIIAVLMVPVTQLLILCILTYQPAPLSQFELDHQIRGQMRRSGWSESDIESFMSEHETE